MKGKDIRQYKIFDGCFGKHLEIDGVDYDELSKTQILEFINDVLKNDINSEIILREVFELCLENLQFECIESDTDLCDQCGNHGGTYTYKVTT